ncbi:MAG: ABZJ_00895 family protein [Maritimibacter sp.]|nr:ABZJ_00895 family protein [Maritimibacter sp.]
MPYGIYTIWFIGTTLLAGAAVMALELGAGIELSSGSVAFVPVIAAAMLAGTHYAGLYGRLPTQGESWRFGFVAATIVLAVSGLFLALIYAADPGEMATLLAPYDDPKLRVLLAAVLAGLWLVAGLVNRGMFRAGARAALKNRPPAPEPGYHPSGIPVTRPVSGPVTRQVSGPVSRATRPAPGTGPDRSLRRAEAPYVYFTLWFLFLMVIIPVIVVGFQRGGIVSLPMPVAIFVPGLLAVLMSGARFVRRNARRPRGGESLGFAVATAAIAIGIQAATVWLIYRYVLDAEAAAELRAQFDAVGDLSLVVAGIGIVAAIVAAANFLVFSLGAGLGPRARAA